VEVARPFAQEASRKDGPVRFQPVVQEERQQIVQRGQDIKNYRQERSKLETTVLGSSDREPSRTIQPSTARITRSPIVARSVDELGKGHAPPRRPEAPKPNPKVEPARRSTGASKDRDNGRPNKVSTDRDDHKPKNR
jgi:hypothetical protein